MKRTKNLLVVVFLMTTLATFTQTTQTSPVEKPFIEVTGVKEMEIVPDEIYIGIVIRERMEDKIKITIEEQEIKLKESIKTLGIDITNLSLSDANADYLRIRWKTKDVILQKDYTLKVSDAATVGKVYLELEKLNIKDAFISKVSHSKIEHFRKEARIAAIKDAKDKADYMLVAIGEQTGKALVIRDNLFYDNSTTRFEEHRYYDSLYEKDITSGTYGGSMGKEDVQFNKIKISISIYAKFEIK